MDDMLYTFCADNKIRIWTVADSRALSVLQLWKEIDMSISIQPRRHFPSETSRMRYCFVIDGRDFVEAVQRAENVKQATNIPNQYLEHLLESVRHNPEICVVLDDKGHMSAWGLEKAGDKALEQSRIFNLAHVIGLDIGLDPQTPSEKDYVHIDAFEGGPANPSLTILVHHYDGRVDWYTAGISRLFDPTSSSCRTLHEATWTGHDGPIRKIVRSPIGTTILSRTDANHAVIWRQVLSESPPRLIRQSSLVSEDYISRSCFVGDGSCLAMLHHDAISLWNIETASSSRLQKVSLNSSSKPLFIAQVPSLKAQSGTSYVAGICADMTGLVYKVEAPMNEDASNQNTHSGNAHSLSTFCHFSLNISEPLSYIVPVDPASWLAPKPADLDIFATDVALAYSSSGTLRTMTARLDEENRRIDWLVTATVATGIPNIPLACGSSIRKAAVTDQSRTRLTIWDTTGSHLEYDEQFSAAEIVQDLDWTSTPDQQSILAVGFPHRVLLLSQLRYDYTHAQPAWAAIREVNTRDLTPHPIGDSCWLGNGNLAIGAGNQLFIYDREVEVAERFTTLFRLSRRQAGTLDLFQVVRRLNGPLPIFHPQFISQCVLSGKAVLVHKILATLLQKLKFQGDEVESFLNLPEQIVFGEAEPGSLEALGESQSSFATLPSTEEGSVIDEPTAASLNELLVKVTLPEISQHEQFYLANIVECVAAVEKHRRSMDGNAGRYLLFFRQYMLQRGQSVGPRPGISWREIVWAFHSESQDILVDLVSRSCQGKVLWTDARESGMFMWLTDPSALKTQLESVARNEYTKTWEKSPVDCSLYYLALGKKTVLQGLWRMAAGNREQASTLRLLAHDFNETRWKTAALKNGYVLLGKHRYEYSAAFFLLADALPDAVSVCVNQLDDLQLGVAIARVYEGDGGPVMVNLLQTKILPRAAEQGNRWMATWAFWMLGKRDRAVRTLISPIDSLLDDSPASPSTPDLHVPLQAKSFLSNDPALVVLYRQLREKTVSTLRGATMIQPRDEWEFILRNARLYSRMGCDLLALDLVRNWEFLRTAPPPPPPSPPPRTRGSIKKLSLGKRSSYSNDPRKLLRRRSSLVVDDVPLLTSPRFSAFPPSPLSPPSSQDAFAQSPVVEDQKQQQQQHPSMAPPPTVFEEPDAASLLDNFGY